MIARMDYPISIRIKVGAASRGACRVSNLNLYLPDPRGRQLHLLRPC